MWKSPLETEEEGQDEAIALSKIISEGKISMEEFQHLSLHSKHDRNR